MKGLFSWLRNLVTVARSAGSIGSDTKLRGALPKGLYVPTRRDWLWFSIVEKFFVGDRSRSILVLDRRAVAALAKELEGDAAVSEALAAYEELLRNRRVVGRPAGSRTHTIEFASVGDTTAAGVPRRADGERSVQGTMLLRAWVVDDRLFVERLAENRQPWGQGAPQWSSPAAQEQRPAVGG